ncbi:MAG: hypothetical protein NVSMB30_25010 [Hymenobacter sp.]
MAPAPEPVRFPYHDRDECPIGQEVKAEGQWQYYVPAGPDETRARCPVCLHFDLGSLEPAPPEPEVG